MDHSKLNSEATTESRPDSLPQEHVAADARGTDGGRTRPTAVPPVVPTPRQGRPMKKRRFLTGMLLSGHGIALMLGVASGALQSYGVSGRMSLPAVGLCMIIGVMLLGGGFGIMATSAGTFDDEEFERLMKDGDPVARPRVVGDGASERGSFRDDAGRNGSERQNGSGQAVA